MIPQKWYIAVHACRVRDDAHVVQAEPVQRLFSMFPPGLPGIGLLLLRASVAAALLLEHYAYRGTVSNWALVAATLVCLAISVGYMTPLAAIAGLVLHALLLFRFGAMDTWMIVILVLDAVALALLGPGAYSVDGARFGRRVVVLPTQ